MNKNFVIATLLVALMAVTVYSFPIKSESSVPKLEFHSAVCIYKNNDLTAPCTHNAMMNAGLNWTRDLIGNAGAAGAMKYIAVGNGTNGEVTTQTTLNAEIADTGLQRAAGTYAVVGLGNWSISHVFTAGAGASSLIVNTTGLFNDTSGGTMFAGKNFANSVTLQAGDQLNVTWYVWVS